jgi:hypothetical protein
MTRVTTISSSGNSQHFSAGTFASRGSRNSATPPARADTPPRTVTRTTGRTSSSGRRKSTPCFRQEKRENKPSNHPHAFGIPSSSANNNHHRPSGTVGFILIPLFDKTLFLSLDNSFVDIISTMSVSNQPMPKRMIFSTTVSLFLALLSTNVAAFIVPSPPSSYTRQMEMRRNLFVSLKSNGEFSRETIESSEKNEWGIPDSRTLDPFSKSPVQQLNNGAKITLVGSGPGDPDLLTVKALKLLQDPNALVICDRLVSEEIRDLVKGEIQIARKLPGCADLAQEEIYWWAYQGLRAGKHVIRLKIGDPFVFGRGGEEILTFRKFGVESEVVPVS